MLSIYDETFKCHICGVDFQEPDTYWKAKCNDCRQSCCRQHRCDEDHYDDGAFCHNCLTCYICGALDKESMRIFKCRLCKKNVCKEHNKSWCGREGCTSHTAENHHSYYICDHCYPRRNELPILPYHNYTDTHTEKEIKTSAYYLWLNGTVGNHLDHYYIALKEYISRLINHY